MTDQLLRVLVAIKAALEEESQTETQKLANIDQIIDYALNPVDAKPQRGYPQHVNRRSMPGDDMPRHPWTDPLADVIFGELQGDIHTVPERIAAAVRARIAAVLDAEEAKWRELDHDDVVLLAALTAVSDLRATLLGEETK